MKGRSIWLIGAAAALIVSLAGTVHGSAEAPVRRELVCGAAASYIRPLGEDGRRESVKPLLFLEDGFYAALSADGVESCAEGTEDDRLCFIGYDGRLSLLHSYTPTEPGEGRNAQRLILCMTPCGGDYALIEQINEYWWDDPEEKSGYRYLTKNYLRIVDAEGTALSSEELDLSCGFFDPAYLYMRPDGGFIARSADTDWAFDASGRLEEQTEGGVRDIAPGAAEDCAGQLFPVRGGGWAAVLYVSGGALCGVSADDCEEFAAAGLEELGVDPLSVRGADMLRDGTIVCVYDVSCGGRSPCAVLLLRPEGR